MAINPNDKVFVVNENINTKYGGVDPTGQFETVSDLKGYKVYTALLTQTGDNSVSQTLSPGDTVELGVSYTVSSKKPGNGWNFSNVGGPVWPDASPFVATASAEPISYGSALLSYVYAAPIVTVLENTIGDITWEYQETGYYTGNLGGGFIGNLFFQNDKVVFFSGNLEIGQMAINIYKNDDNQIGIDAFKIDGTYVDSALYNVPIEIRVYN